MVTSYFDVAQLKSKIGLDGRFAIDICADLSFLLSEGTKVWLVPPQIDAPRCVHVKSLDHRGDSFSIEFDEVSKIDIAECLVGAHCLIQKTPQVENALKESSVKGLPEILNWSFLDQLSGVRGTVQDVYESAGQILLEVTHDDKVSLVPYVDEFVLSKDYNLKEIVMTCPRGLFEL